MSAELSCSCELTGINVLEWNVLDLDMMQVGGTVLFSTNSQVGGIPQSLANGLFTATVTETATTLTSVANGTISQITDGYTLQCFVPSDQSVVGRVQISIPGKLLL